MTKKHYFYSHAPCGARLYRILLNDLLSRISTHTPHAGRDESAQQYCFIIHLFLLTRPMRGATVRKCGIVCNEKISTHTPHAGRDACLHSSSVSRPISTHTPHAGRDGFHRLRNCSAATFLLTRPMRGATSSLQHSGTPSCNFYSHAPCGARR